MSATGSINEAKDDLDTAMGEIKRVERLVIHHLCDREDITHDEYAQLMESIDFAFRKVKRARSEL